jgi:hypothetical protein
VEQTKKYTEAVERSFKDRLRGSTTTYEVPFE